MSKLNAIGLDGKKAKKLSSELNDLLSNYQVFYMNVRGFHWNIQGEKFFELHLKFEELYNNLLLKVDEIAERVLTLGDTPVHAYSDYITRAKIKEAKNVHDGKDAVGRILESFKVTITKQRELLELAAEAGDEGTNALMSDYIREQEKLVWMYSATLKK
ncbi:MAG: DNA starvation/stationary phase protection protein [Bacteroidetes bacterium]|nr:DNA starvation/stationary phase protection protein [Bacteroidota bacterium]